MVTASATSARLLTALADEKIPILTDLAAFGLPIVDTALTAHITPARVGVKHGSGGIHFRQLRVGDQPLLLAVLVHDLQNFVVI